MTTTLPWITVVTVLLSMSPVQRPWSEVAVIDGDPVMRGDELVIGVTDGSIAKAYSTWHLNGHEIVNDMLGTTPIAVTWCPLCFTGVVYRRVVGGRTRLLLDAMNGDASLFARSDEIAGAGKLLDPIISAWETNGGPRLGHYAPGSWGPSEGTDLASRDGRAWRIGCGKHD